MSVVAEPGELLVQSSSQRGTGEPDERRVTTDGDVLQRSTSAARYEDGEWHFDTQSWEWRRVVRLQADELQRIRDVLAESGFFELDAVHRPEETSIGGSNVTWTAELDGRTHEVQLIGVPDVRVEAVEKVQEAVEAAIAGALDRQSRS